MLVPIASLAFITCLFYPPPLSPDLNVRHTRTPHLTPKHMLLCIWDCISLSSSSSCPAEASAVLEELEETAKLWLMSDRQATALSESQIQELRETFGALW